MRDRFGMFNPEQCQTQVIVISPLVNTHTHTYLKTTHLLNQAALKMDGAQASDLVVYIFMCMHVFMSHTRDNRSLFAERGIKTIYIHIYFQRPIK